MNKETVKELIGSFIYDSKSIIVKKTDLNQEKKQWKYNKLIRDNIAPNKYGVYLWRDLKTNRILYIGMAGKIAKGKANKHDLCKRLVASRGKDENEKDVSTSNFLKMKMNELNIESIEIEVFVANDKIAPAYLEAILLQKFWELSGHTDLPKFNKSF